MKCVRSTSSSSGSGSGGRDGGDGRPKKSPAALKDNGDDSDHHHGRKTKKSLRRFPRWPLILWNHHLYRTSGNGFRKKDVFIVWISEWVVLSDNTQSSGSIVRQFALTMMVVASVTSEANISSRKGSLLKAAVYILYYIAFSMYILCTTAVAKTNINSSGCWLRVKKGCI